MRQVGVGWLEYLQLGEHADEPLRGQPGKTVGDFLDICATHAVPAFQKLAAMQDPAHPQHASFEMLYLEMRDTIYTQYIAPPAPEA